MKRLIALALVMLLLWGCSEEPAETTQAATQDPTKPTVSLYDPNSDVEELTGGAVKAYPLGEETALGFRFMDRDILLFTKDPRVELTTVSLLHGDSLLVEQSLLLDCAIDPADPHILVDEENFCYYNLAENSLVILDRNLEEVRRIRLPDDVTSEPVICADLSQLYYCVGDEIRALDLQSGISRLLKHQECQERSLLGFHFGDTILETFVTDQNGVGTVDFVSSADGQSLGGDGGLLSLQSGDGRWYLLQRQDGVVTETLVGDTDGTLKSLALPQGYRPFEAFSSNGVLMANGGKVAFVSLTGGKVTARIDLGNEIMINHCTMDPSGNAVWILGTDLGQGNQALYRWDITAGEVQENTLYIRERFDENNPDDAGIRAARAKAETLGSTYGVKIYVDDSFTKPEGYRITTAYQGEALQVGLELLERAFAQMPEGFFQELSALVNGKVLRVVLVREILTSGGAAVPEGGLHYAVGGDHYVVLAISAEMESLVYHELCHVMDAAVYGGSKAYDDWQALNPEGFVYLGTDQGFESLAEDPMLGGEARAFVDAYSMTFAREDRARVFEYAMGQGNEQIFASPIMQAKLQRLSQGIREAFGWKDTEVSLPWEQYLKAE